MKKLVIVVHEDCDLLHLLRQSTMYYIKIDENAFMYIGSMSPWDKAAGLIATFHPNAYLPKCFYCRYYEHRVCHTCQKLVLQ